MNEEKVPDDEFRWDLTPIEEEILHYTEETFRLLMEKARANELRKRFATPPPMKRIEFRPNPHLPEMQFPQHAVIGMPKPGPTEADKEALKQAISEGMRSFNEAVRELLDACVYIRNEIERRNNDVGPLGDKIGRLLEIAEHGHAVYVGEAGPDPEDAAFLRNFRREFGGTAEFEPEP